MTLWWEERVWHLSHAFLILFKAKWTSLLNHLAALGEQGFLAHAVTKAVIMASIKKLTTVLSAIGFLPHLRYFKLFLFQYSYGTFIFISFILLYLSYLFKLTPVESKKATAIFEGTNERGTI